MYTLDRTVESGIIILYASGIQTGVLVYWWMSTIFHAATIDSFLYAIDVSLNFKNFLNPLVSLKID